MARFRTAEVRHTRGTLSGRGWASLSWTPRGLLCGEGWAGGAPFTTAATMDFAAHWFGRQPRSKRGACPHCISRGASGTRLGGES